ncbi:MAG: thioesterase [Bacteroidia bacterium]|nr:thioesterase [Bacteroidia bacterium]
MAQVTQQTHRIRPHHVGPNRKITVPSLIDMMHIVAWDNAELLGASVYDLHNEGITWAMIKYRLEVHQYPDHNEDLTIESYPSGNDRTFVYRDYRAFNQKNELVAEAASTWLVMDLTSRKMTTLRDYMEPLVQVPPGREPLPRANQRLRPLKEIGASAEFPVSWHELDPNHHVSNTHYFRWALEAFGEKWLDSRQLQSIEVHFKAETHAGDRVKSSYHQKGKSEFLHEIQRLSDGKPSALAISIWKD